MKRPSKLTNTANVKKYILEVCKNVRHHPFTQVSSFFLEEIERAARGLALTLNQPDALGNLDPISDLDMEKERDLGKGYENEDTLLLKSKIISPKKYQLMLGARKMDQMDSKRIEIIGIHLAERIKRHIKTLPSAGKTI